MWGVFVFSDVLSTIGRVFWGGGVWGGRNDENSSKYGLKMLKSLARAFGTHAACMCDFSAAFVSTKQGCHMAQNGHKPAQGNLLSLLRRVSRGVLWLFVAEEGEGSPEIAGKP